MEYTSLWSDLIHIYLKPAVKRIVRPIFAKLAGTNEVREEFREPVDTLYFFLNHCVDIRNVPKATGSLRQLQESDAVLLRLFHEICVRNNLTYWLDYGTLLGAVRHRGFIPWDDDMDVGMPRDVYDQAKEILTQEFAPYGISVAETHPLQIIKIGYNIKATGVWLDVFPVDSICIDKEYKEDELLAKLQKYKEYYFKNQDSVSPKILTEQKEKLIGPQGFGEKPFGKDIFYHGPEFPFSHFLVHERGVVYPLTQVEFEGFSFFAPHDMDAYLRGVYGDSYMGFPRRGLEHHGEGRKISLWASDSGTDMTEVRKILVAALDDYMHK